MRARTSALIQLCCRPPGLTRAHFRLRVNFWLPAEWTINVRFFGCEKAKSLAQKGKFQEWSSKSKGTFLTHNQMFSKGPISNYCFYNIFGGLFRENVELDKNLNIFCDVRFTLAG